MRIWNPILFVDESSEKGRKKMKFGRLLRIAFSIILAVFSPLHALSGGIQGALLSRENPGQGALWGAIGAAGAEVAMEEIYDPKARSQAILDDMEKDLRERKICLSGHNPRRELEALFTQKLRADVEGYRNLVRVGMSGVALAAGTDGAQMSMMDDMADQALTHNYIQAAIPAGLAALEAAMPGLLAAAVGALGVTYAWDAVTGLFSASTDQGVELPFNTTDDKLPVKGKPGNRAQEIGQSTAGGMMPEDPDHEPHNEEEPDDQKHHDKKIESDNFENKLPKKIKTRGAPENWEKKFDNLPSETAKLVGKSKHKLNNIKGNCGARGGKPSDATTLNAAKIEKGGGQIELAKQRGRTYDHVRKVEQDQKGLQKISDSLKRKLDYPNITPEEIAPVSDTLTKVKRFLKYTEEFVPKK